MDQWLRKVLMRGVGPGQLLLRWKVTAGVVGVNHDWPILRWHPFYRSVWGYHVMALLDAAEKNNTWWNWRRYFLVLRWRFEQVQTKRFVLSYWNTSWYLSQWLHFTHINSPPDINAFQREIQFPQTNWFRYSILGTNISYPHQLTLLSRWCFSLPHQTSASPGCAQLMRWGIPQHVLYLGPWAWLM